MKKSIREERSRIVIKEDMIEDNSLLQYIASPNGIDISVRFIDTATNSIKDHLLKAVPIEEFEDFLDRGLQINESQDTIAIFKKTEKGMQLERLYYLSEHNFEECDFLAMAYQKKFPNQPLNKYLVYEIK